MALHHFDTQYIHSWIWNNEISVLQGPDKVQPTPHSFLTVTFDTLLNWMGMEHRPRCIGIQRIHEEIISSSTTLRVN